jgi:hypothetical protein
MVCALAFAAALAWPRPAAAQQQFPTIGGLTARAGAITPEHAGTALGWTVELDAGYWGGPRLRTFLGLSRFDADVERRAAGLPVAGSFTATAGLAGVRWNLFEGERFTPYVTGALTALSVDASVDDEGVDRLLEGFYFGATTGAGLAMSLDVGSPFAVVGEVRRAFVTNVGHWGFEVGFQWTLY